MHGELLTGRADILARSEPAAVTTVLYGSREGHSEASPNSLRSLAEHGTSTLRRSHLRSFAKLTPTLRRSHLRSFAESSSDTSPKSSPKLRRTHSDASPKSPPKLRRTHSEASPKSPPKLRRSFQVDILLY